MGALALLFAMLLILTPVWLVFTVLFVAVKFTFKLTFWALELALLLVVGIFWSGGFLAFLGIMLAINILVFPCFLLFCRR